MDTARDLDAEEINQPLEPQCQGFSSERDAKGQNGRGSADSGEMGLSPIGGDRQHGASQAPTEPAKPSPEGPHARAHSIHPISHD